MTNISIGRPAKAVKLTEEQEYALDVFREGGNQKVIAYAGAGKTSTLVEMARSSRRHIQYLAFNRAVADEAETKFPSNCEARTSHSHAFRACIKAGYPFERLSKPFYANQHVRGSLAHIALVSATLRNFYYSDDAKLTADHVPDPLIYVPGRRWTKQTTAEAVGEALKAAAALWAEQRRVKSTLPLGHDAYLKIWALSNPKIAADAILLDEAQDSNPALLGVLRKQAAQLVLVGDQHQQIYEWRGARDALASFDAEETRLTQSFRFGQAIADEADRLLEAMGESVPLFGSEAVLSSVAASGAVEAVLCRTNAAVIAEVLGAAEQGQVPYVLGGTADLAALVADVERIESGQEGRTAELLGFTRWRDVQDFATEEAGAGLRALVHMVGKHGTAGLRRALGHIAARPKPGSLTLSTAHKAKGQEWRSVRLSDDFLPKAPQEQDGKNQPISMAQRRLFYVAATRAKSLLVATPGLLGAYQ